MIEVQCQALLFDLDGVLIDSTPAVTRVWSKWARARGFDPEEVVAHAHGRPSIATVREYLPNADHEAENRIVEQSEIEDLEGVVPLPGARELLESLPAERWTIVTSGTRALASVRLRAAGLPAPSKVRYCHRRSQREAAPGAVSEGCKDSGGCRERLRGGGRCSSGHTSGESCGRARDRVPHNLRARDFWETRGLTGSSRTAAKFLLPAQSTVCNCGWLRSRCRTETEPSRTACETDRE